MASNPPFHVEDQTDEDFFDKLIEDDVAPIKSGHDEANDPNDCKAFSVAFENSNAGESGIEVKGEEGNPNLDMGLVGAHAEERNSLLSSGSVGCDSTMDLSNDAMGSESILASTASSSTGITSSEVKEVGWNAFNADSNEGVGFGSYSDIFNELGDKSAGFRGKTSNYLNSQEKTRNEVENDGVSAKVNCMQYHEEQNYDASLEQSTNGQDLNSSQYWENLYPGWKYDPNSGQWYQIEGYNATACNQGISEVNSAVDWSATSDERAEISYMQRTAQSVAGTLAETGTTESVSSWGNVSQGNNGYPEYMVFDPQYPGWYYDTIAQEWRSLESFNSSVQSTGQGLENGYSHASTFSHGGDSFYKDYGQSGNYESQAVASQNMDGGWNSLYGANHQQSLEGCTTEIIDQSEHNVTSGQNHQFSDSYASNMSVNKDHQNAFSSFGSVPFYDQVSQSQGLANGTFEPHSFAPHGDIGQHFNYSNTKLDEQNKISNDYHGSQKIVSYSQQSFQGGQQFSHAPQAAGRSSAGRPPHALVAFGFGGKLVIMKDSSLLSSSYGSQDTMQCPVLVLNLMEVVMGNINSSSIGSGIRDYFCALCQQSFPGPLVGGVGNKELYKWIDERIAHCESPEMDYSKGERLRLLLSLLKIACQHYGKLRSPFGTDTILKENDAPESAVAKLFASAKTNNTQSTQYGVLNHCLQNLPSDGQMLATASEVQNLLVSGKKKEAFQCAQEGQLWGPALVLASQLGDQFYVDTVRQMALCQLVAGSPLRTLCLLIAGQPAEVFSADATVGAVNLPQQHAQIGSSGILDDWEENLAVITANRTKDDELVIIHLGDCLWKERSQIVAAHICYLVAEANFESYSDTARLCLIGADHWKFPRTYASPEAIQRTELYEYSKVLGNSQFILLPFQPYKLIYAYMLAEMGKVSDSLKYCQAVLKSLKTGRAPEVETWKQLVSSLEERIRTHQQGGYATNLAPAKLVGKLLNFFDSTAHRVVGGPPPMPSMSIGSGLGNEQHIHPMVPRVPNSQSTMAMSSLVEPTSEWTADSDRKPKHNRSVSEPDFGRTPVQANSSHNTSPDAQGKASVSGGTSRFSRFGFGSQLLQKTVGLVLGPRTGRQAKLGEKNKFYYDEKLKRWVEEGVEPPAEEAALPPPPTTAAFQNGNTEYNLKSALTTEGSLSNEGPNLRTSTPDCTSGIPPIPPSSNHFSARGRMGIRARYVDTFNQGGGSSANSFKSPSVPSVKPSLPANAKFFIPAPAPSSNESTMEAIAENSQEDSAAANEDLSTSTRNDPVQFPAPSVPTAMQRFPSMGSITTEEVMANSSGSLPSQARRAVSWNGGFYDASSPPPKMGEIKPLAEALGMPPLSITPQESDMMRGNFGEDLQEVEL